jgi:hypothetical protein
MKNSIEIEPAIDGEEEARRAVAEQDGHRVVVGLGEEVAGRRSDDVRLQTTSKLAIIIMSSCSRL